MRRGLFGAAILVFFLFAGRCAHAQATCLAVTPSGAGSQNGSNWSNALAGLPGTLTRGTIYYVADGTYLGINFSTGASGTSTVEVRKAQSYDFGSGTNCSSSIGAGWNTATMGSGQATFGRSNVGGPYFILNGNGTQTTPGCGGAPGSTVSAAPPTPADCGIRIDDSQCSSSCMGAFRYSSTNLLLEYVEFNANSTPSANEDNFFFGVGGSSYTVKHMYGHNTGAVYFQYGGDSSSITYSYFWGTEVQGVLQDGTHGQAEFENPTVNNGIRAYNVYRDITGTAVWTFANPGGGTNNNWQFYGNVIWNSTTFTGATLSLGWLSDGLIACINSGVNCTNFTFSQNTVINVGDSPGINNENTGSYTVENNLYYSPHGSVSYNVGTGGTYTEDHNSYIAAGSSCPSGTANVCDNAGLNPFVNWLGGVFSLASDNADWDNRASLGSPFNTDAAGNAFTTDRGAYQFSGSVATPPQPATNLLATPH